MPHAHTLPTSAIFQENVLDDVCYCSLIKLQMLFASDGRHKNLQKFELADIFHIPAQATKELGNILQVVI